MFSLFRNRAERSSVAQREEIEPKTIKKEWYPDTSTEEGREQAKVLRDEHPLRYLYFQLIAAKEAKRTAGTKLSAEQEQQLGDIQKKVQLLNTLDAYIERHQLGEQTLRGRQVTVFEDIRNWLEKWGFKGEENDRSRFLNDSYKKEGRLTGPEGYVHLPTGVGKTVLFIEMIEALNARTVIVVPKQDLVEQTYDRVATFAPNLEVGRYYADRKELGKNVTIITYDSLQILADQGEITKEDIDVLVLDEVHRGLSERRMEMIRGFDQSIRIGFTATDAYSEEKSVRMLLPDLIHSMQLREAVEESLLCDTRIWIARVEDLDTSQITISAQGEYSQAELEEKLRKSSIYQSGVQLYKTVFAGQKALGFCAGITSSDDAAKAFCDQGITAESYHSDSKDPAAIMERFVNGKTMVLTGDKKFIEGSDIPAVSVALNFRLTRSRVDAAQRGGRAMRLNAHDPEKVATIIDFIPKHFASEYPPILFTDILGAAEITKTKTAISSDNKQKRAAKEQHDRTIAISGLTVINSVEEVMEVTRSMKKDVEKTESANGWMTTAAFASSIGLGLVATNKIFEEVYPQLLAEGATEEELRRFLPAANNRRVLHYGELAMERIRLRAKQLMQPEENWRPIIDFTGRQNREKLDEICAELIAEGAERKDLIREYYDYSNRPQMFYSLTVQQRLRRKQQEAKEKESRFEGWHTLGEIEKLLNRRSKEIPVILANVYAKFIQQGIPEEHIRASRQIGKISHYIYSPDIIDRVKCIYDESEAKKGRGLAPEGWETIDAIVTRFAVGYPTVRKAIDIACIEMMKSRGKDTVHQNFYDIARKKSGIHYSPEVIALAQQKFPAKK